MWQKAADRMFATVHAVFGLVDIRGSDPNGSPIVARMPVPLGTCFLVDSDRVFLTNAHVVNDEAGATRPSLQVVVHLPTTGAFVPVRVVALDKARDLALIAADAATEAKQVIFANKEVLPMGTPAASFGFRFR